MQEWNKEAIERRITEKDTFVLYLYTPICGTCQVASKMLVVLDELMSNLPFGQSNVNYLKDLAEELKIESVPCLLIYKQGELQKRIYAFQSVPYLLEVVREVIEAE